MVSDMNDRRYDAYFDPRTGVLLNLSNITDASGLKAFERRAVMARAQEALAFAELCDFPGYEALCEIHRLLFQDVYAWAGKSRSMPIAKGQSVFAAFVGPNQVDRAGRMFVNSMEDLPMLLAGNLAELWGELNYLHPFVEGNGRATQILLNGLAHRHGHDIAWSEMTRAEELNAAIASCVPSRERNVGGYVKLLAKALRPIAERNSNESIFPTK